MAANSALLCQNHCGRATFDGRPGYCSIRCMNDHGCLVPQEYQRRLQEPPAGFDLPKPQMQAQAPSPAALAGSETALCQNGCGRPTFKGDVGYCSIRCMSEHGAVLPQEYRKRLQAAPAPAPCQAKEVAFVSNVDGRAECVYYESLQAACQNPGNFKGKVLNNVQVRVLKRAPKHLGVNGYAEIQLPETDEKCWIKECHLVGFQSVRTDLPSPHRRPLREPPAPAAPPPPAPAAAPRPKPPRRVHDDRALDWLKVPGRPQGGGPGGPMCKDYALCYKDCCCDLVAILNNSS